MRAELYFCPSSFCVITMSVPHNCYVVAAVRTGSSMCCILMCGVQVLQPIKDQLGADLISMVPDNATFNYVLSTSVVPGKAYTLADLINLNGQTLTALTGNKVNVTVKQ